MILYGLNKLLPYSFTINCPKYKKMREHYLINKEKTTFTLEKISRVMEEKAFFTAKEREQLFALYKRLLQLSGDTLQKGDCHKLKYTS